MDETLKRDAMLHRMAMATPGGPLFSTAPLPATMEIKELVGVTTREQAQRLVRRKFDEAQSYATSQRALVSHPMLISLLAKAAGPIREALDRGETVVITAGNGARELARYEP